MEIPEIRIVMYEYMNVPMNRCGSGVPIMGGQLTDGTTNVYTYEVPYIDEQSNDLQPIRI